MSQNLKYVLVSLLVLLYFLLEYTWIPWDEVKIYIPIPFIYKHGPVRLDSYIYNACVKIEHIILPVIVLILTPFKKESRLMILAFTAAFVEFFFTWNEPVAKIWMPNFWGWQPYIPVSTSPLKFASICYFMYAAIDRALRDE